MKSVVQKGRGLRCTHQVVGRPPGARKLRPTLESVGQFCPLLSDGTVFVGCAASGHDGSCVEMAARV